MNKRDELRARGGYEVLEPRCPKNFVTASHYPFDDSEMGHIIEHSKNLQPGLSRAYQTSINVYSVNESSNLESC